MNKLFHNEHNLLLPQEKTFSNLPKQIQEYLHQKQLKLKQYTTKSRSTVYTLYVVRLATERTIKTREQAKNKSNRIQETGERTSEEASREGTNLSWRGGKREDKRRRKRRHRFVMKIGM